MGRKTGERKPEWNKPNEKALKRLLARRSDFDRDMTGGKLDEFKKKSMHRPGSMKG